MKLNKAASLTAIAASVLMLVACGKQGSSSAPAAASGASGATAAAPAAAPTCAPSLVPIWILGVTPKVPLVGLKPTSTPAVVSPIRRLIPPPTDNESGFTPP